MKKIVITGLTGQDGSYMADYCLAMPDVEVYGVVRRTAQLHDENFKHLKDNPRLHILRGDLLDGPSLDAIVRSVEPDYFFNFAAQSFVGDSWKIPEQTFMATAVGVLKCLEAIRNHCPSCRFYNAGSSEEFGDIIFSPQNESHPFRPRSPYGAAKCAAHHLVKVYRESYDLYAIQGTLFNHESERRGEEFVTRKITKGFARIIKAIQNEQPFEPIALGNIDAKRDWSHAKDFMVAVWRMLNQEVYNPALKDIPTGKLHVNSWENGPVYKLLVPKLKEYVVSSGQTHTIREFIQVIIEYVGFECHWKGEGASAQLIFNNDNPTSYAGKCLIKIDPQFYRPADVQLLLGDSSNIRKDLQWVPNISFDNLVKAMLTSDLNE